MSPKTKASAKSAASVKPSFKPADAKEIAGKLGMIVKLLRRKKGAGISELVQVTGWQEHSVRGALAGALKRKHGLIILSEKTERGRIYRIVPIEGASASEPSEASGKVARR